MGRVVLTCNNALFCSFDACELEGLMERFDVEFDFYGLNLRQLSTEAGTRGSP